MFIENAGFKKDEYGDLKTKNAKNEIIEIEDVDYNNKTIKLNIFTTEGIKQHKIPYKELPNYIKQYQLFEEKENIRKIIREGFKKLLEDYEYEYKGTYTAPQQVIDIARNALNKTGEINSDNPNEGSGINKAQSIVNGNPMTHSQLKRMKAFFDNNENNKNLSWELWGGDAGRTWAEDMINSAHHSNDSSKTTRNKDMISTKTLMDPNNTRNHTAYSRIKNSLTEDFEEPTMKSRLDSSVYLRYVELGKDQEMKSVSKEKFSELMRKYKPKEMKSKEFNKNNRDRFADRIIVFKTRPNVTFGEFFSVKDIWSSTRIGETAASYWVNKLFLQ